MVKQIVISESMRNTIYAINRTQDQFDINSNHLATGKKINSALDNPQSFFTSQSLNNRASDLAQLLDGIGQSIRAIETASHGVELIETLLNQAESVAQESLDYFAAGETDPAIQNITNINQVTSLDTLINASAPDVYFRLNETSGSIIDSGAAGANVGATYQGSATAGASPLYANGASPSVDFNGTDAYIAVNDDALINTATHAERTIEATFNADTTTGRQIIYEEGATVNGFSIYIDDGTLYFSTETSGIFTDIALSTSISANQTYHASLTYNAPNGTFSAYVNGSSLGTVTLPSQATFPTHVGDIGIGGINDGAQFHDGETSATTGNFFNGRISNVAIYNRELDVSEILSHAESINTTTSLAIINEEYSTILEQIDNAVIDAHYRGINLLDGDDLVTIFNEDRSSSLTTEGANFRWQDLGLRDRQFDTQDNVEEILSLIGSAIETVRSFSNTLTYDLSIIETRFDFTQQNVVTLNGGADDLTLADQNQEGAELLANGTRLTLGQTALSLAAQTQASTLRLF